MDDQIPLGDPADRREIWEVVYKNAAGRTVVWARCWDDRDRIEKALRRARENGWPNASVRMCVEWRTAWVEVPMGNHE
jgi:hypothetical protein